VQPIIDDESPTDDLPKDIPLGEIETAVREYEDMRDAEANAATEAEENMDDWIYGVTAWLRGISQGGYLACAPTRGVSQRRYLQETTKMLS
jgi:hypothetical protein